MNNPLNQIPNKLVGYIGKRQSDFTRNDIIRAVQEHGIQMVNFMYPGGDGRLKTLNFIINDIEYLQTILTTGERVDGSSLFPFIDAQSSDLYVIPRYRTAFIDPFSEIPTITMLCSFFDKDGKPLESAPEYTLAKACDEFKKATGLDFYAMGELEYYVAMEEQTDFPAVDQHGYHESEPFAKTNTFRTECMSYIAQTGGRIKYGHSEVGNFTLDGLTYEQNEIEFLPVPAQEAADQLMLAKWVIRNLAYRKGYNVTFAPKITTGKAGSGLHIHMCLMNNGRNAMLGPDLKLSDEARKMIAGLLTLAPSITAFGNTVPTSYFRLVPHQEAPTSICWGDRNRSVLVRVPLGWTTDADMSAVANPSEKPAKRVVGEKQTVEIRSADGSANVYQLLAALAVACRYGFELDDALGITSRGYVSVNIHSAQYADKLASLESLPDSCAASARCLEAQRSIYEKHNIFSPSMLDAQIAMLRAYDDSDLRRRCAADRSLLHELVMRHIHCG